jgi:2-oxoacid:acceptor oxidoreductase gamma subunit (pyruvate/2-ketoisovalerate family)
MKEVRMMGRGGQGTVIAAEMLAAALAEEGKWVSAFPSFGVERRGAPVDAFLRFDNRPIAKVSLIEKADCLIVLDRKRANSLPESPELKPGAIMVLNVRTAAHKIYGEIGVLGQIDATAVAMEEIGKDISNTVMMGAFARCTGWVGLEAIGKILEERFQGRLRDMNMKCLQRGYEEVRIVSCGGVPNQ